MISYLYATALRHESAFNVTMSLGPQLRLPSRYFCILGEANGDSRCTRLNPRDRNHTSRTSRMTIDNMGTRAGKTATMRNYYSKNKQGDERLKTITP